MIEKISISDVATFHPNTAEVLDDLRPFNYIFGSNGSDKTTISRVIADSSHYANCRCIWKDGRQLDVLVLNRDFVENNFNQLRGVFTLGEQEKVLEEKLNATKLELTSANQKLAALRHTLGGDDGNGGKYGDLMDIETEYRNRFWVPVEKLKKDKKLEDTLTGVMGSKEKCKEKILDESVNNTATLKSLPELEKRAETILGETPIRQPLVPAADGSRLIAHESDPILTKKIIGRNDVDIAAMINKLENSDWVQQGLSYYKQNDRICPFCQQSTSERFAQSLQDYFDETFERDTQAIETLIEQYHADSRTIQTIVENVLASPGKFLDVEKLKVRKVVLDQKISANKLRLEKKKKEPSEVEKLDSLRSELEAITGLIDSANADIANHNHLVGNFVDEKRRLIAEVWRFVLHELDVDLKLYRDKKLKITKAIEGIKTNILNTEARIAGKSDEIRGLEKQTTSIQQTINDINATLQRFGFDGFSIADAGDEKHYKIVRANGDDARPTLSEGEKTFLVFLYFYNLLKGSFSDSGITVDRVVVFDDPVSSLDSDVLFIVSSLIKEVREKIREGSGHIKQLFVLTHNVYFHKQVTYDKRAPNNCRNDECFWVARRSGSISKLERFQYNPIKSSYELLWQDVRQASQREVAPNTLRRILEHYYTILGSFDDLNKVMNGFEGRDKLIAFDLLSFLHAGSHSVFDDAYMTPNNTTAESYLRVFKKVFDDTNHGAHYQMMMGTDQTLVPTTTS